MQVPAARVVFTPAERDEIAGLVSEALATGALTLGPLTRHFEEGFAARHRSPDTAAPHAVAVASGTAALEIILRGLDVAGADVVVPSNTFYATAGAVVHAGARPVFADVSADALALTAATVEAALTPATKAVVLVHIAGLITPEVDAIRALCDARGVILVEDAAHAHGSSFDGRPAGSFGAAGAFSFYPTKVMTSGEGGMIVTADGRLADEARIYRDQGKAGFVNNDHVRAGHAWRMSELHAAVGVVHLRRLDDFIAARRSVAHRYDAALAGLDGLTVVAEPPGCVSNYYKYVVLLPEGMDRAQLKKQLKEETGVSLSGEVYTTPLHRQPVFAAAADQSLPGAEDVCARQVCLPVHSDMTDAEVDHVIDSFARVYRAL